MRVLRHLFDAGRARRRFPPATLDAIQKAIAASEHRHRGEIVFAVEGALPLDAVLARRTPRERAVAMFSHLRVWNTEDDTGVLVYLLLADHAIEIVADRGISARVDASEWTAICALMQSSLARGEYLAGALAGVDAITRLLVKHFPADGSRNPDELPDRPVLL